MKIKTKALIIGSGPAGCTAALYLARANTSPTLVAGNLMGGQLMTTTEVENFPGFISIKGPELMKTMIDHAKHYGTNVIEDMILSVDLSKKPFIAIGEKNTYVADTIIIATGAEAKWLNLESETKYRGFGISACATCDGPFFKNKEVAVIGGGNTAATEALYMTHHAKKVYLIHRRDTFTCEDLLIKRLKNNDKIEILTHYKVGEFLGEEDAIGKFLTGIKLDSTLEGQTGKQLKVDGAFVAIGHHPNTGLFKGQLELDHEGYVVTKNNTVITNIEGVYACGDVQDKIYKQAITSAGSGCMAALEVEEYLGKLQD